ncbi:MAG: hypothetical protein AAF599_09090, partial [Bacteroidota bacterium]
AMLLRGRKHLENKKYALALKDFEAADEYPENQSIGRDEESERRAQIFYYQGLAYEKMRKKKLAMAHFEKATQVEVKEEIYNYERALALQKLGQQKGATDLFQAMLAEGKEQLNKVDEQDFFSKFGKRETENVRRSAAHQLIGLGQLGLGNAAQAKAHFQESIALHPGNFWVGSFEVL